MVGTFPPLVLLDDVLCFEGENFFQLVNKICGGIFKEFMEIVSINTVYKLLLVQNGILCLSEKIFRT